MKVLHVILTSFSFLIFVLLFIAFHSNQLRDDFDTQDRMSDHIGDLRYITLQANDLVIHD